MNLTFSERLGLKKRKTLGKDEMSEDLRNSLWSVFSENIHARRNVVDGYSNRSFSDLTNFFKGLWIDFFKRPTDELEISHGVIYPEKHYTFVRNWFFNAKWFDVYEILEYTAGFEYDSFDFRERCNHYLNKELAAYRFIDKHLLEINSKEEIAEIERVLQTSNKYKPVQTHLSSALKSMTHQSSDYRNSIKESISAVESCCNILLDSKNEPLGQALKKIEKIFHIPRGIKNGFSSIYGYASHEDGIRHGLTNEANEVNVEEARFMLITSSAFINYLLSKSTNN